MRVLKFTAFLGIIFAYGLACLILQIFPLLWRQRAASRLLVFWSRNVLWVVDLRISEGPPESSLPSALGPGRIIIANHLSYLDIPVIASRGPCVFLGKHEISRWPLIGAIARGMGMVFVDRSSLYSRARALLDVQKKLQEGFTVVIFPEGTTTRSGPVKGRVPFYNGAFRIARMEESNIEVLHLDYENYESACAWLGDESFVGHLWTLLNGRKFSVRLRSKILSRISNRREQHRRSELSRRWLLDGGRDLTFFG